MIEQAVVLVGGRGTRLEALTTATPKPMLAVGGRPFLRWLVDDLRRQGVCEILLLAGFAADVVRGEFAEDTDVEISVEPAPLGTGGALRFARPRLKEAFLLLNGDSMFHIDCGELPPRLREGEAVLALRQVPNIARYGAVTLESDRITAFQSSGPSAAGLINGGVAYVRRCVVDRVPLDRAVSLETEIYPTLALEGLLRGSAFDAPFIDIGTPEDFARAQTFVPDALRRYEGKAIAGEVP